MNYGKKSTAKKRTALISRSSMMGKRARVSFIRVLFVSLIALCIAVTCLGVGSFRGVIDTAPDVDDIDIMPLGYATFLYDDAGNQIRKLAAPDSNRLPVTLDQIPVDLQHAVVAIEDERFYEHNGIDVKGILRAGMKALTTEISQKVPVRSHSSFLRITYLPTGPVNLLSWKDLREKSRNSTLLFRLRKKLIKTPFLRIT